MGRSSLPPILEYFLEAFWGGNLRFREGLSFQSRFVGAGIFLVSGVFEFGSRPVLVFREQVGTAGCCGKYPREVAPLWMRYGGSRCKTRSRLSVVLRRVDPSQYGEN
jgi:hypothetical protein